MEIQAVYYYEENGYPQNVSVTYRKKEQSFVDLWTGIGFLEVVGDDIQLSHEKDVLTLENPNGDKIDYGAIHLDPHVYSDVRFLICNGEIVEYSLLTEI